MIKVPYGTSTVFCASEDHDMHLHTQYTLDPWLRDTVVVLLD